MSKTKWFLLAALLVVVAAAAVIIPLVLLREPTEKVMANDIARQVVADAEAAQCKYQHRWLHVTGKVEASVEVPGDEEPYHAVFLDTGQPIQVLANFGPGFRGAKEGDDIIFEGHCTLCERGIVQFDDCVLASK